MRARVDATYVGPNIVKNEHIGREKITWMVGMFLIFAEVHVFGRRMYSYIFLDYVCERDRESGGAIACIQSDSDN